MVLYEPTVWEKWVGYTGAQPRHKQIRAIFSDRVWQVGSGMSRPFIEDEIHRLFDRYNRAMMDKNRRGGHAWQFCELAIEFGLDPTMVLEDALYRGYWNGSFELRDNQAQR